MYSYKYHGQGRWVKWDALTAIWAMFALTTKPAAAVGASGTPSISSPLNVTHPYHPLQPDGIKVLPGSEGRDTLLGLHLYLTATRSFDWGGTTVECRVLREIASESGELVEVSDNSFAQADDGTVYCFGEVVDNYEDGVVADNEGSWLIVGPALSSGPLTTANDDNPTIFTPANPEVGDLFKPEDLIAAMDETAQVVRVGVKVKVPAGAFEDTIAIEETSALAPRNGMHPASPWCWKGQNRSSSI